MNVVKRGEYCNGVSVKEVKPLMLSGIPQGTVFRGALGAGSNKPQVWVKTNKGEAACIGEPHGFWAVGFTFGDDMKLGVRDYEVLNATLVIEGE